MVDQAFTTTLRFGGGINSSASEDLIDDAECTAGQNFCLDTERGAFCNRLPLDLVGTAPNAGEIRGFAQLEKADGSLSQLIQAGGNVYEWDGTSAGFTLVGTVSGGSRIRGPLEANFILDDEVIITDLERNQKVMTWDGTTFQALTHNLSGDFFAKQCIVENERALFRNVRSGTATPHLLVASKRGDHNNLTVTDRPSSALSAEDPFFIPSPDLKAINGMAAAFGRVVFSTEEGATYQLQGNDATDFAITGLHPGSFAAGDEALVYAGNDIIIAREGKIDTLFGTQNFGDILADDLSDKISGDIENVTGWSVVFDDRKGRVFFLPDDDSTLYVFHKKFFDRDGVSVTRRVAARGISPWVKWRTQESFGFRSQCMWAMKRPGDKVKQVYIGGPDGKIYQFDGQGAGDNGSNVKVERISKLIAPDGFEIQSIEGEVFYKKRTAETLALKIELSGSSIVDVTTNVSLVAPDSVPTYGGTDHYNGTTHYNVKFAERRVRQRFTTPGTASEFQVRATVEGTGEFQVEKIVLRFEGVTP